jgi:hypothetical protein
MKHIHVFCPSGPLAFANRGQDILSTNYWQSDWATSGLLFLSVNSGAFRLLIPPNARHCIPEMKRGAKHIVLSLGQKSGRMSIELLFEDKTSTPYVVYIETKACDRVFAQNDVGKEWIASVWDCENGQPHKCFELPAYCQVVNRLPWLKGIER